MWIDHRTLTMYFCSVCGSKADPLVKVGTFKVITLCTKTGCRHITELKEAS